MPIIPLYFSRDPGVPLRGYSLVDRSYDQFRELNVMRTYQAQGVRRMARQWLMRAGFMSEDAVAKLSAGRDGEVIEVDLQPGMPLEGNIISAPQAPIPADISLYANTVENDIREAGLLAPFTRGEVSRTTATEANLLQSYTSNELGRMARQRDEVITSIARTYNIILSVVLGDEAEPLALPNPVGPTMLSADDLTGDFRYWAVDAGSTPAGDMMKRQSPRRPCALATAARYEVRLVTRRDCAHVSASRRACRARASRTRTRCARRHVRPKRRPLPLWSRPCPSTPAPLCRFPTRNFAALPPKATARSAKRSRPLCRAPMKPYNAKVVDALSKALADVLKMFDMAVEAETYSEPVEALDPDLVRFLGMVSAAAEDFGKPLPIRLEEMRDEAALTRVTAALRELAADDDFREFLNGEEAAEPVDETEVAVEVTTPTARAEIVEDDFDFASRMRR